MIRLPPAPIRPAHPARGDHRHPPLRRAAGRHQVQRGRRDEVRAALGDLPARSAICGLAAVAVQNFLLLRLVTREGWVGGCVCPSPGGWGLG